MMSDPRVDAPDDMMRCDDCGEIVPRLVIHDRPQDWEDVTDDEPCPHDCAIGIGHVTTPEWSRVIWECTVCHAIGEDTADNTAIVWAEADE